MLNRNKAKAHQSLYEKDSPLYRCWSGIKDRTGNPNCKDYKSYGERGIKMYRGWLDNPQAFIRWAVKNGWKAGLTCERMNVDKGYYPENLTWVDRKAQANNRRTNVFIKWKSREMTIAQWADLYQLPYNTLYKRIQTYGWDMELALRTPVKKQKKSKII